MMKRLFVFILLTFIIGDSFSMKLSNNGKEFIKRIEKCSLTRYWDNDAYSIGYGHHMPVGTKQYTRITRKQAEALLVQDLRSAEKSANKIIGSLKWKVSQQFFDGLVSVIYNCGEGGLLKTEFYSRLQRCRHKNGVVNNKDLVFTIAAIKTARIPKNKQLAEVVRSRRQEEHAMML